MSSDNPPTSPPPVESLETQKTGLNDQEKELLKGLGMSPEDMSVIGQDMPSGLQEDIARLMGDPSLIAERQRFVEKYIYDRIIGQMKEGETMSQLARRMVKEGHFTMDQYTDFVAYYRRKDEFTLAKKGQENEGKMQVIIAKKSEGKVLDEVAINREKEKKQLNETLAELNQSALSRLDPKGSSLVTEGVASMKSDPAFLQRMEDQGYPKEEVRAGKWDQTLTGYYLAERGGTLRQYVTEERKKDFDDSIGKIRSALGFVSKSADLQKFLSERMISGDRKIATLEATSRIIRSGSYNIAETTYDTRTGMITFIGKDERQSARIDTSRNPPTIEYWQDSISISDDLKPMSETMKVYVESTERAEKDKIKVREGNIKYSEKLNGEVGKNLMKAYEASGKKEERMQALNDLQGAKSPEENKDALERLRLINSVANQYRLKALSRDTANMDFPSVEDRMIEEARHEKSFEEEKYELDRLIDTMDTYLKSKKNEANAKEKLDQSGGRNDIAPKAREETIRSNLAWLTGDQADFDKLGAYGNDTLHRIVDYINSIDPLNPIDLKTPLDKKAKDRIISTQDRLIEGIGYSRADLRNGDTIDDLRKALAKTLPNRGAIGSIENILRKGGGEK